jgi:hypothetical protein
MDTNFETLLIAAAKAQIERKRVRQMEATLARPFAMPRMRLMHSRRCRSRTLALSVSPTRSRSGKSNLAIWRFVTITSTSWESCRTRLGQSTLLTWRRTRPASKKFGRITTMPSSWHDGRRRSHRGTGGCGASRC